MSSDLVLMINKLKIPKVNFPDTNCSAVTLTPTSDFFIWLREIYKDSNARIETIYHPEEDPIWIIPREDYFESYDVYMEYLEELKRRLIYNYLGNFVLNASQMPVNVSPELFDKFLSLEIKDRICSSDILFIHD